MAYFEGLSRDLCGGNKKSRFNSITIICALATCKYKDACYCWKYSRVFGLVSHMVCMTKHVRVWNIFIFEFFNKEKWVVWNRCVGKK
jgi:hypothetical protein